MIRFFSFLLLCFATTAQADTMRLAVTTSFHNSGLSDVLLPAIQSDTGIEVQLLVVGTGQALRLGEAGDVDAIFVHSRAAEEAFIAAGYGTHRTEIMYNDFVFIGPTSDPAQVGAAADAASVMRLLHANTPRFVSRGDDSGTHKKEKALWQAEGLDPVLFGNWYAEVGAGMGASLNTAAAMGGYIMSDRASWLNFANKRDLEVLFAGDPALFNQYAFLPVNPDRFLHVNTNAAREVEEWLTSPKARDLINGYKIAGQPLFTFNAGLGK